MIKIKIEPPDDCDLLGVKTEGDTAILIYEERRQVRKIGFVDYETEEETEDEEEKTDE